MSAQVVARFTADIGDLQAKMRTATGSLLSVADAATMSTRRFRELGEGMADVGKKMTVGVTLPLGGVGIAATKAAMDFESSMTKITALVGIASDEVAKMGTEVLSMAGNVGKAPEELSAGLFVITSAGLRGAEAMSTLKVAAMAGAAGLGETNDIARAVAGALSAYGSEVLSASEATDQIVATARAGNFETSQFAAAIGRVLPFAQQAGASFADMGGAVALLTRVNGNAAESVTQMTALFRAFVVPTEEAKTALGDLGLSAEDMRKSIADKGLPATLQMLDRALGGNREQLGRLLGSSEAASAAFQILNADGQTIRDTFGVVADSAGMTADAFNIVAGTTQFQLSAAMAELRAGLIEVGESLLPIAQAIIDFASRYIKAFNSLPGPAKQFIVIIGGLVAAIGPLLFIVGKLIATFAFLFSLMMKSKAIMMLRGAFVKVRTELTLTRASVAKTGTSFGMLGMSAQMASIVVGNSFRTMAVAARGLFVALGPIGIAIVGITVVMDSFVGRAAAMEGIISSLRDEVDLTTQALTTAGEKLAAQEIFNLISPEDRAALEAYGISMGEVLEAVINGGPAMEDLQDKLRGFRNLEVNPFGRMGADSIRQGIDLVRGGVEGSIEAANSLSEANQNAALRTSDAARGMAASYRETAAIKREADRNMTDSQRSLDAALEAGITAVEGLSEAFQKMQDVISDEASIDSAYRAINRLGDTLKDGSQDLKGYSDEALDNRAAIRDAAQAWIDYAADAKNPIESQKRLAEGQKQIRDALKAAGIKPEESDIFKTLKKQQEQSGKTVDEFAKQRDIAKQYGNDVGSNFIDGILAELARRRDEVEAAAAANTSALVTGGNAGIDATSPSRDAMKIAGNFVDGVVIGLRSRKPKIDEEARRAGNLLTRAFAEAMNPRAGGPAGGAFAAVFGSREDIRNSARALQDASWALADARDAVVEAEKALSEARKEGNAREVAAAERDLARARRDAADATDVQKAAKFVAENQKALIALQKITQQYDYITNALEQTQGAFTRLTELTATPFGLDSVISQMFGSDTDVRQLANNFAQIEQVIRDAYAVLIDPKIVGRGAARENRRAMQSTINQIEEYVAEMIELREELDAGLIEEDRLKGELDKATRAFDEANNELKRIVAERDGFMKKITDGFRGFVNSLSGLTDQTATAMKESTRDLGNGVRLIMQAADPSSAAGAIAANLESRLAQVRAFSTNLRDLMKRGLDPAMIRDFIEAGVSGAGDTVAALVGATDDELKGINATQAELLKFSEEFAKESGDTYYAGIIAGQQTVVNGLQAQVVAAQAALDTVKAQNKALAEEITTLGETITTMVEGLAATLPAQTLKAGQDAIDKMIEGFNSKFPEMKRYFSKLMDDLVKSMRRTVTIDVRTSGAVAGSSRTQARSFNTGTVPLASTSRAGRSVTIAPNAVNVTVTGGTGANVTDQVRRAVDESLQELAREIIAA